MNYYSIIENIRPSEIERNIALELYNKIASFIKEEYEKDTILVGSVAKDTFLKKDADLDVFVLFNPDTPRNELEKQGINIGKNVFRSFNVPYIMEYAEHPYLSGNIDHIKIEIVPCYKLKSAANIQSAVDRSPFHLQYIMENLEESQRDQVRLLKRFLKAQKLYGADARTNGFSGYLCELLICRYKSFENLIQNAATWNNGKRISFVPATKHFEDPLIVIDPVDSSRNVASAVSRNTFSLFIDACARLEASHDINMFKGPEKGYNPCNEDGVIVINIDAGKIHEDAYYSQARRLSEHIVKVAGMYGFSFFRKAIFESGLVFDTEISKLPPLEKHMGPLLEERKNAASFKEKNTDFFTENGKLYSVKKRRYTDIIDVIEDIIKEKNGMGTHFKKAKYSIKVDKEAKEIIKNNIIYF